MSHEFDQKKHCTCFTIFDYRYKLWNCLSFWKNYWEMGIYTNNSHRMVSFPLLYFQICWKEIHKKVAGEAQSLFRLEYFSFINWITPTSTFFIALRNPGNLANMDALDFIGSNQSLD